MALTDKANLIFFPHFQLQPDLRELYDTMNRLSLVTSDFEGKIKVNNWLSTFQNMAASDELDDGQSRQMIFDLDSSYNAFNKLLHFH